MGQLEDTLGKLLNDPHTMEQLSALAGNLGGENAPPLPGPEELALFQKFSALASQAGLSQQQTQLLQALRPYLGLSRLQKLEQAMRAAQLAESACAMLGPQTGR